MKAKVLSLAFLLPFPGTLWAQGVETVGPPKGIACAYNSVLPTLNDKAAGWVQCDSSGRLIISNPGGSGGGGAAADQTATNAADGQATRGDNQHVIGFNYIFNGATWDRARGTGGAANVAVTSGTVTANQGGAPWVVSWSGQTIAVSNFPATQAISAASLPLPTGAATDATVSAGQGPVAPGTAATKSSLAGLIYNSTAPTVTNGQQVAQQADPVGNTKVSLWSSGGLERGLNSTPLFTAINATNNTGGIQGISRLVSSAASTNANLIKASGGRVYKVYACNTTVTEKYIRLFNKATAPVPGTDTPFWSRVLPRSSAAGVPLCQSFDTADLGYYLTTGIGYDITGAAPDTDTTALAAGDVTQVSIEYQ